MAFLKVNNVDLSPYINSMQTDYEPIWNEKAGRAIDTNATFTGRIVAKKWKINVGVRTITQKESAIIHSALKSSDLVSVQFIPTDSATDDLKTITCYVSSMSNKVYSYNSKLPRYSGMTFNLIEQ